jgi:hypothetical protein
LAILAGACAPSPTPPPPTITGDLEVGATLTASVGGWVFEPAAFRFEWRSCATAALEDCVVVGEDAPTYVLQPSDEGRFITVTVTASNAAGSAKQRSAAVGPVEAPANSYAGEWTFEGTSQNCGYLQGQIICSDVLNVTRTFTLQGPCDGEGWCRVTLGDGWGWSPEGGSGCLDTADAGYSYEVGSPFAQLELWLEADEAGKRIDVTSQYAWDIGFPAGTTETGSARQTGPASGDVVPCS